MKKFTSLFLLISIVLSIMIFPSSGLKSGDFQYTVNQNEVYVDKYLGTSNVVIIPETIDGKKVQKICNNAFLENKNITEIKISEGVKSIGDFAFKNCSNLSKITLPKSLNHIGKDAFLGTAYYNNEKNWKIPKKSGDGNVDVTPKPGDDVIEWEDICAGDLTYLYIGTALIKCHFERSYLIKHNTTVIADYALYGENKITELQLRNTIKGIGSNSFNGCENLGEIVIPEGICKIGDMAFANCSSLKKASVPQKLLNLGKDVFLNSAIYNDKNNWYNNEFYIDNHLIKSESQVEAVIREGTKFIEGYSLKNIPVYIPSSVEQIDDNAFENNTDVVIYGINGTEAQLFAQKHNIPFVDVNSLQAGDMNFDGQIDVTDFAMIKCIMNGEVALTTPYKIAGDVNGDTSVDGFDAITLMVYLEHNGNSIIRGDANGDRVLSQADFDLLCKVISGEAVIENGTMFKRCDLNNDGAVDGFDAVAFAVMLNR